MSGLRAIIVKPMIVALLILSLMVSLALTVGMMNRTPSDMSRSGISQMELQTHSGPGKHNRCKPKGKYGKPERPKNCRRRPNRP